MMIFRRLVILKIFLESKNISMDFIFKLTVENSQVVDNTVGFLYYNI